MSTRRQDRDREIARDESFANSDPRPTDPKGAFVGLVIDGGSIPTTGQKYCLVNPVDASGDDAAAGAVTLTADATRKVVVAMISGIPVAGDYLLVEPEGNRWVAEKFLVGYAISGCSVSGYGCGIPEADLTLSWLYDNGSGATPVTTTLTYIPPGSPGGGVTGAWATPAGEWLPTGASGRCTFYSISSTCSAGTFQLSILYADDADGTSSGLHEFCTTAGCQLPPTSCTASPFSVTYGACSGRPFDGGVLTLA